MPTARKVGRRLFGQTITSGQRKDIHRWFNTPKTQREPRTAQELADQLGIHRNMLYYLRRQPVDRLPNKYWGSPLESDPRLQDARAKLMPAKPRPAVTHKTSAEASKSVMSAPAERPKEPPKPPKQWASIEDVCGDILLKSEEERDWIIAEMQRRKGQPVTWPEFQAEFQRRRTPTRV